ncbi:uncharacterized protein TNCV_2241411 [Trichonephila clavipes]|nr:uncharacterized protein TNCV_2241411 [Trichonephila clavipes]
MQVSPVPASDEVCPPVFSELLAMRCFPGVRSAGYKCLPFLLVMKCDRLYFASARILECSCVSSINLKCIMAFLLRERKDVLLEVAKELRVEIDITLPKIEFKKRICQSKYYDEESVKCLLEGILAEKQETRENEWETREYEELNKSVENATSCDFEKKNCDPPVRWTNVSHPSEVRGKEFNVYRNSNCEVKMKSGLCEGRVKTVAMGEQRVINPNNIGAGTFEMKGDKGVANPEGLIRENICEEKYTIGTLMGCEKQLTVDQESFRNHTMAKIAGHLNGGKENICKADV